MLPQRRVNGYAAAALACLLVAPAPAEAQAPQHSATASIPGMLQRAARSVVQVRRDDWWGTGFLYPTSRHVVTAYSVVNQRSELTVAQGNVVLKAQVIAWSENHDLAILELSEPISAPPLALDSSPRYAGESVVFLGHPTQPDPKRHESSGVLLHGSAQ